MLIVRVFLFLMIIVITTVTNASALMIADEVDVDGLNWLAPFYSQNIDYNDIVNELSNTNSQYYGYSIATVDQVDKLLESYGHNLVAHETVQHNPTVQQKSFFTDFHWNTAYSGLTHRSITGYVLEDYDEQHSYFTANYFYWEALDELIMHKNMTYHYKAKDNASGIWDPGTWLVRGEQVDDKNPVPEPTTALLFGLGLLGLTGVSRRKK